MNRERLKKLGKGIFAAVIVATLPGIVMFATYESEKGRYESADVIMVRPKGNCGSCYVVVTNGYGSGSWWISEIIVKVDPEVPEGKPRATFWVYDSEGIVSTSKNIEIAFHSADEVKECIAANKTRVEVKVGDDSNVHVSGSGNDIDNSGCFIGSLIGG